MDELVFTLKPLPGVPCPHCQFGYVGGSMIISNQEVRIRPGTKCATCRGKGRVKIVYVPIEDGEEAPAAQALPQCTRYG